MHQSHTNKHKPTKQASHRYFLRNLMATNHIIIVVVYLLLITTTTTATEPPPKQPLENRPLTPRTSNETIYMASEQLCWGCIGEALEFLVAHNMVRARKWELPLVWDPQLENYARWWAGERSRDCALQHSFPEDGFKLGECIFWGSGASWMPKDAVGAWADEEKYYHYDTNTCDEGEMCGHYTQVVWSTTRRIGCARVVCDDGDVFITCNYYPPGNYIGERPY